MSGKINRNNSFVLSFGDALEDSFHFFNVEETGVGVNIRKNNFASWIPVTQFGEAGKVTGVGTTLSPGLYLMESALRCNETIAVVNFY